MIRVAIVEDDAEVQGVLQEYVRRYTRQYGTGRSLRTGWTFWRITARSTILFFWMWR